MAHFPKPAAGSWTANWPELGTAPVNYEDSIDPEHFKLEQQAIFKKTWLNIGRVERLPKKGSYFTREMPSAGPTRNPPGGCWRTTVPGGTPS